MRFDKHLLPLITATKMMLAAAVAFLIIDHFHLREGYWSIITIAAITQAGFHKTWMKSIMRVLGTIIGALIGYGLAVLAQGNPIVVLCLFLCAITVSSFIALQPTVYSYAGIIAGMTISIVMFFSLVTHNIFPVAVDRSIEILLGVGILLCMNLILSLLFPKRDSFSIDCHALREAIPHLKGYLSLYAIPAVTVALACSLTLVIWMVFRQPQGYWATITCLLIMEESLRGTRQKAFLRFLAHVGAAVFGLVCVLLLRDHYLWRLLPLMIAFFACGYLIGAQHKYASFGNTAGIAIVIMLLASIGLHSGIAVIFERFYNVLLGITIAFFTLHYISGINRRRS